MNNKQMKKATVDAINVMISHADKGPSGFWVEARTARPERTLFLPMECRHYVRRWAWQHKHGVLP